RKVELSEPLFKIRRDADGNWNLPQPAKPVRANDLLPTLVVHQGTMQYEDRLGGHQRPTLELRDLSWTALNDPLPHVTIQGQGQSLLGALKWTGAHDRTKN